MPGASLPRLDGESISDWMARMTGPATIKQRAEFDERDRAREQKRKDSLAAGLVTESPSNKRPAEPVALPVHDGWSIAEHSSQEEEETREELLSKFGGGRKTPLSKQTVQPLGQTAGQSATNNASKSEDTFVGFGHETSQRRPSDAEKSRRSSMFASDTKSATTSGSTTPVTSRRASESKHADQKCLGSKVDSKVTKASSNKRKMSIPKAPKATGKRSSSTNPSVQDRTLSLGALPKIRKKASASAASPGTGRKTPEGSKTPDSEGIDVSNEERPPRWYKELARPTKRKTLDAHALVVLERLNSAVDKGNIEAARGTLHELAFTKVDWSLLKYTHMLNQGQGLQQIFDSDAASRQWPYDVRADAEELYNKWCRGDFETDLLRGLVSKDGESGRNNDKIQAGYAGKVSFNAYGHNGLANGQWWPTQLCTVRDGAHGMSQSGISGKKGQEQGAYSVVMTGEGGYANEDHGDWILYCGTDSKDGELTSDTQMLVDSLASKNPVRFIRSYKLGKANKNSGEQDGGQKSAWAPTHGYRYDGLYEVTSVETLATPDNALAARRRFKMVRLEGQDPIRGKDSLGARPTPIEIRTYQDDKRFR